MRWLQLDAVACQRCGGRGIGIDIVPAGFAAPGPTTRSTAIMPLPS